MRALLHTGSYIRPYQLGPPFHTVLTAAFGRVLRSLMTKKPLTPDERVLMYAEFAAEFDVFENLDIYGRRLNFFQYYSLDVVIPILLVLFLLAFLLAFSVFRCYVCAARAITKRRYAKVE